MLTVFTFICVYTIYSVSRKLGYKGWEFFIPGFNIYKAVELATGNGWLCLIFLVVLIPFVGWIAALVLFIIWWLKISGSIAQKIRLVETRRKMLLKQVISLHLLVLNM